MPTTVDNVIAVCVRRQLQSWKPLRISILNLDLDAHNLPEAKPIITVMSAPPQRDSDPKQRYQMSTWNLYQLQLSYVLGVMSYFPQGQWLFLPGWSKPALVVLRLGLVITDLMEARMVSGTPSNFAIACNTKLGVPLYPVPTVAQTPDLAAAAAGASTRSPVAEYSISDGDSDYESDVENGSLHARNVDTQAGTTAARVFNADVLERAVQEVERRPPVRHYRLS